MDNIEKMIETLSSKNKTVAAMESCTGGGFANSITNIQGASKVLKYSAVTYSDEFKVKMGVPKEIIDVYGVYSEETAMHMAKSISNFANSDYGIGITGQINREAFVSIYESEQDKYFNYNIQLKDEDRVQNKNEIISQVVYRLNQIL